MLGFGSDIPTCNGFDEYWSFVFNGCPSFGSVGESNIDFGYGFVPARHSSAWFLSIVSKIVIFAVCITFKIFQKWLIIKENTPGGA